MKSIKQLPTKLIINGETYALAQARDSHRNVRTLGRNVFTKLRMKGVPITKFMGLADGISYMTLAKIDAGERVRESSYEKCRRGLERAGL